MVCDQCRAVCSLETLVSGNGYDLNALIEHYGNICGLEGLENVEQLQEVVNMCFALKVMLGNAGRIKVLDGKGERITTDSSIKGIMESQIKAKKRSKRKSSGKGKKSKKRRLNKD